MLSPNSHVHEVGEFREESMNCTESGAVPEETFAMNDATGLSAETGHTRNAMVIRARKPQNTASVFMLEPSDTFFPDW